VTRCGSVGLRVTRSLVPVDPVGLSLLSCCSSSFVLASALLPSLSSLVPKVSREVCVCFRLFVCDSRSCDWDIGRVLLRKNFYRLPFTPPSLVANPVLHSSSATTGLLGYDAHLELRSLDLSLQGRNRCNKCLLVENMVDLDLCFD
jgi:hypothetical protein